VTSARIVSLVGLALVVLTGVRAAADDEDLPRQIQAQRAVADDLERLDDQGAEREGIAKLRAWLDEASRRHSNEEFEKARELLVRCIAQAELIRHRAQGAQLRARVQVREAEVRELGLKIDRVRRALDVALERKKELERKLKSEAEADANADAAGGDE